MIVDVAVVVDVHVAEVVGGDVLVANVRARANEHAQATAIDDGADVRGCG